MIRDVEKLFELSTKNLIILNSKQSLLSINSSEATRFSLRGRGGCNFSSDRGITPCQFDKFAYEDTKNLMK